MNNFENDIWEAITSVLNGNPTPEEQQLFDRWINEYEGNRRFYQNLLKSHQQPKTLTDDAKERIFAKVKLHIQPAHKTRHIHLWKYSAVASVAILIGLGLGFLYFNILSNRSMAYVETKSPLGIITTLKLSDSTVVHLAPGSSLRYPATFKKHKREINLDGEAYFEVTKDKKRPFIVHTNYIDIHVFGTKFNVKAFGDDSNFITTLVEGSVGVYNNKLPEAENMVKLKPNQQSIYNNITGKISLHNVDAKLYSEWKDGRTYFENETFASIVKDIERKYDVSIKIDFKELEQEKFSGLMDKRKTVYQLLDGLGQYGNFDYQVNNDTIIIFKK
jgi:ferric-dicitrate binding protein FerR (iron transport regulator)